MKLGKMILPKYRGEALEEYVEKLKEAIRSRDEEIRKVVNRNYESANTRVRGWLGL